jgi:glycerol-3-phosphate acyltransferase PlsY
VSAASLSASVALPPALWLMTGSPMFLLSSIVVAALIAFQHRENIGRLMAGTEPAFKMKRDDP